MPTLYDPYGREIRALPKRPPDSLLGAVRVRDQYSSYPSTSLTPEKLAAIFREADSGHVSRQAELFEEIEEKDPDIASLFQTRKLAVQGLDFEISPASDSAEDKKIADAITENVADLELDEALLDLLDAIAKGFAAVEINWDMSGGQIWASGFSWIHQKRLSFYEITADYEAPLLKLPRLLTKENPVDGVEIPSFKVIYHRYKARSGFAQRAGLMRTVAYYYLFKNYDIKDWVIFLEKFGQPLRLGKFSPGAGPEDIKILREAVQNLGTDAGAVISESTMLEIVESKTTQASSDLYERAADFFNKSFAKAILGQTATIEGTPGKLGSENERGEVRRDLIEADARALSKTIRSQLLWPMVGFNFGWDKKVPNFNFIVEEPEDLEALSRMHRNLLAMGVPMPLSFVQKKYGIPAPESAEVVLQPRQVSPFDGFQPERGESPFKKKVPIGSRLVSISD